jgi:hypothetical protein
MGQFTMFGGETPDKPGKWSVTAIKLYERDREESAGPVTVRAKDEVNARRMGGALLTWKGKGSRYQLRDIRAQGS